MLIRNAELDFGARLADLRVEGGVIRDIAPRLVRRAGEEAVDARGGALLPALRDHHIHLYATAAARASVSCGPPQTCSAGELIAVLKAADARLPAGEWLRGVGFHDSVMADSGEVITRPWLDRLLPDRPLRIQHRSGRLWWLNTAALRALGVAESADADNPLERVDGSPTGRLYDADDWLRERLGSVRPSLASLSRALWQRGVTAVTDASHGNGLEDYRALAAAQASGELLQDVRVMGTEELDAADDAIQGGRRLWRGERKFHLHARALPDFDTLRAEVRAAHAAGRGTAFHCVDRAELVYAQAALREAGLRSGDRIEHAGVAPPELVAQLAALRLTVVTQPGFVVERGDVYLREVHAQDQPWLYPARSFLDAGVPFALSSDAPYTSADPWQTVAAAVARTTGSGVTLGAGERLTPEQAVDRMTTSLDRPGGAPARLAVGGSADLCLLPVPWQTACSAPASVDPVRVWCRGFSLADDGCPCAWS